MSPGKRPSKKYVVRASHDRGWIVRFPARVQKVIEGRGEVCKSAVFFADSAFGGKAGAESAALAHRDEVFKRAGLRVEAIGAVRSSSGASSVTGLCGVVPGYRKNVKTGKRYVGRWYALQGTKKIAFSVTALGMKGAFWEAVRERQRTTGLAFTLSEIKAALRVVRTLPSGSAEAHQ